jgi:hypothetical protein
MNRLHSIYLTGKNSAKIGAVVPERIAQNIESFRRSHPESQHKLYGDHDLRRFIDEYFDGEVLKAYDALKPLAYKADLGRYCLLYEKGGIYADVSIHFYFPLEFMPQKMYVFRDGFSHAPWILSNSLIYAPAKQAVFEACIKRIVHHVSEGFYGFNPLCPTGPNLFGREFALCTRLEDFLTGEAVRINRDPHTHSFAYLTENGQLIAVSAKRGAGLASLGGVKDEDYNEAWHSRKVYKDYLLPEKWSWPRAQTVPIGDTTHSAVLDFAEMRSKSTWMRALFRFDGRPIKVLRVILLRTNGEPRALFRRLVFKKSGAPRRAFALWMAVTRHERERRLRLRRRASG